MPLFYIVSQDKYFIKGLEEKIKLTVNGASFVHHYANDWEHLEKIVRLDDPAVIIYQLRRHTPLNGFFFQIRRIKRRLRAVRQLVITDEMITSYQTLGENIPGCYVMDYKHANLSTVSQLLQACLEPKLSFTPKQPALSYIQHRVLNALAIGMSAKKIAAYYGLSPKTIYTHKYNSLNTLGINNNYEYYRMLTLYRDAFRD
ncbi:LuxR C-terminal-related transcriptional regulator [Pantoea sp. SORGH_AS_0659]|uniref:helix-turn-helix domain-containing protein n=1 Tax=Pantoea sp. SORGH_AS_0659 TaxID=3062597 RepID=UPI0028555B8A|nr:LuxR C-terminal-related transcriptional regulator [Pantoea sp. SORGH_AS_0659]MDR6352511.1 DNA-binding NarL/FixJ family response regulator [Pantoea sp. SORGH_AS_0659]